MYFVSCCCPVDVKPLPALTLPHTIPVLQRVQVRMLLLIGAIRCSMLCSLLLLPLLFLLLALHVLYGLLLLGGATAAAVAAAIVAAAAASQVQD